jgi:hypothetical protein
MGEAEEAPDGQARKESQRITPRGLRRDEGRGPSKQHEPFQTDVENAGALVDEFPERRKQEDRRRL